jgi:hypothetical protein
MMGRFILSVDASPERIDVVARTGYYNIKIIIL